MDHVFHILNSYFIRQQTPAICTGEPQSGINRGARIGYLQADADGGSNGCNWDLNHHYHRDGGGITHAATVSLTVTGAAAGTFSVCVSPTSGSLDRGQSGYAVVTVTGAGGFDSAAAL